jgi:hypothetical protein
VSANKSNLYNLRIIVYLNDEPIQIMNDLKSRAVTGNHFCSWKIDQYVLFPFPNSILYRVFPGGNALPGIRMIPGEKDQFIEVYNKHS